MIIEDVTPEALRGPTDEERSQQIESMDCENTALRDALDMTKRDIKVLEERLADELNLRIALIVGDPLAMHNALREAFEAWFSNNDRTRRSVLRSNSGDYLLIQADQAWKAWQAAANFLQGRVPC